MTLLYQTASVLLAISDYLSCKFWLVCLIEFDQIFSVLLSWISQRQKIFGKGILSPELGSSFLLSCENPSWSYFVFTKVWANILLKKTVVLSLINYEFLRWLRPCSCSLTLESAHVKFDVWTGPKVIRTDFPRIDSFTLRVNSGNTYCSSNFWVCWQNPMVWPFKWNLFSSTFALYHYLIERFFFECRKTKTKVISLTNHNSRKQSNEPFRARSKYMSPVPSAGKRVRVNHDWSWFYFWLVEEVARDCLTNHKA